MSEIQLNSSAYSSLVFKLMFESELILQTDKILLRPTVIDDFKSFEPLTSDPLMWIYFTSDLSVPTELKAWVESGINEHNNNTRLPFTIINKSSDRLIGSTSFGNFSFKDRRVEIGWTWIAKEYQGSGVNSEIKYLMLKYAFETLNFERVEVKTDVLNVKARRALSRIGFKEEGVLRSHTVMTHGRRRDTLYYSILKAEWNEVKIRNQWR